MGMAKFAEARASILRSGWEDSREFDIACRGMDGGGF